MKISKMVWAINLFINISLNVTWSEHKKKIIKKKFEYGKRYDKLIVIIVF